MPVFVETRVFSRQRAALLDEVSFRDLQNGLLEGTTRIDTIPGSGGLKKARWGAEGGGRSGGLRVIFYEASSRRFLLLLLYSKNVQDDLTPDQLRTLRALVRAELADDP